MPKNETPRKCNRNGCRVEDCTRYSETYGWICPSCFEELIDLTFIMGHNDKVIEAFMASDAMESGKSIAEAVLCGEFPVR